MIIRDKGRKKRKKNGDMDRERPTLWSKDHGATCPSASHPVTGMHSPQGQLWEGAGPWPGGTHPSQAGLSFLRDRQQTFTWPQFFTGENT